ncbi:MAG TPA: amidohydrolase [candidate division WOR-3 bacterium]|uniref:5-methylthioadenosine/S-adenosylhomocysteine deaminase n=1 Tax=candidate division WOR-3 bacterium TaxID=2052148 RepID=A0A7C0XA03_UNCW3|nr:MAG: S-adenosylhomocysteine deaminase [Candidatus Hydrothermae bacterium]HDM89765.1 amidohydrolase [candidate division WOR-3 bacterium]
MREADLIVEGDYVLPIDKKGTVLRDASVVIRDGKIEDILPVGKAKALYSAREKVGGSNYLVMPGFVNTHTHAAMVAFRGLADDLPLMKWLRKYIWPRESRFVTADFIRKSLPLALAEMIASGITTFADMYFFQDVAAEIVRETGLRAVLGEGLADFPTPSFKKPEDGLRFSREFIESHRDDPLIIPALAPHAPYSCSPDLLKKSCELSKEYDVPYLIHVAETADEVEELRSRKGLSPVKYLEELGVLWNRTVAAHMVWLEEDEFKIVKKRKIGVSHNPTSNLKLASGIAPVPKYLRLGVKIGLGTDGAASNNDLDFTDEMHLTALIHKVHRGDPTVVKAAEVVYMATLGGAEVLGIADETGSLEKGKSADIILIDLDRPHLLPLYDPFSHLVYALKSSDITHTIVRGKILYEKGSFRTLDVEKASFDMKELQGKLR